MKKEGKKSSYVFIDTEYFIRHNFNFLTHDFQKLSGLAQVKQAFVLTSEITNREIFSNIEDRALATYAHIKKIRKTSDMLSRIEGLDISSYLSKYKESDVVEYAKKQFQDYFSEVNVQEVDISKVSIKKVIDDYFNQSPPFSEKKKVEFPDAFVLDAISRWCKEKNENIYVVSKDLDWEKYCKESNRLFCIPTLTDFLKYYCIVEKDAVPFVSRQLNKVSEEDLIEMVEANIENVCFENPDMGGDVSDVSIMEIEIDDYEIIELDAGHGVVDFYGTMKFSATINYSYADPYERIGTPDFFLKEEFDEVERSERITIGTSFDYNIEEEQFEFHSKVYLNDDQISFEVPLYDDWNEHL